MKICCVKTSALPAAWTGSTGAFKDDFFSFLSMEDILWIERPDAENDNSYKQIIPYIIVQQSSGKILCYPRHGSESRLHGFYSCGIGGHIDIEDKKETLEQTVITGMLRELNEELADFKEDKIKLSYKGIINEIETPVGQVHLGLVFTACCLPGYIPQANEELEGMDWKTADELAAVKKELWSDLALKLLDIS